jgi:hypothetical protein
VVLRKGNSEARSVHLFKDNGEARSVLLWRGSGEARPVLLRKGNSEARFVVCQRSAVRHTMAHLRALVSLCGEAIQEIIYEATAHQQCFRGKHS